MRNGTNLRNAVEWSIENRPDASLEMVNCLGYLSLDNLNNMTDMLNWLWELLAHPANSARTAARALGLLHWSWYANANYERYSAQVQTMNEESISIYAELGDENGLAHAYVGMALTSPTVEVGKAFFRKGITLLRETNDKVWIAYALRYFGWMLETQDYASKRTSLEESLAIYRKLGFTSGIIEALSSLARLPFAKGTSSWPTCGWMKDCRSCRRTPTSWEIRSRCLMILATLPIMRGIMIWRKSFTKIPCPGPARNACRILRPGQMPGWDIYTSGLVRM